MSYDDRVLAVIQAVYDAGLDETRWPDALRALTDLTGSQAATFWVLDGSEQPRLPALITINFDPAFVGEYVEHMAALDPTNLYLVGHPQERIVHDGLFIEEREKDRSAYYDWQGRHTDVRFRLIGQISPAPVVQAGVALHRTRAAGRYESKDIDQFQILYRHLAQAIAIGFRLGSLGTLQKCSTELLDRNPAAVLLLDDRQHVVFALHSGNDGVRLSRNGILLARKQDHDRLQTLIAQVLSAGSSASASAGGAMRAARPSGRRPYAILVTPTSRHYPALSTLRPAVCVVITDPDCQRPLPNDRLQAVFGLTEAEARLGALLAAGQDLRSAAATLGITYGTARARLTEIFQKTETRRQGELVRVLLTSLGLA
jgi:DNA-binding CsgD family transcriptional regulator